MKQIPVAIFSYKIDDILEEITKRTSYLGKMRKSDTEPFLVDRLSLTSGENFMFTEFLEDSVSQVYDWLKAFGRTFRHSNSCEINYNDMMLWRNHGLLPTIDGAEIPLDKYSALPTTYTLLDETDGEIDLDSSSNTTWVLSHLTSILGAPLAIQVMNSQHVLYFDGATRQLTRAILVDYFDTGTGTNQTKSVLRDKRYDDLGMGVYAWSSGPEVFYFNSDNPSIGDVGTSNVLTYTSVTVSDVDTKSFTLPKITMYDVSVYESVIGITLSIANRGDLGVVKMSPAVAALLDTTISGQDVTLEYIVKYTVNTILGGTVPSSETLTFTTPLTLHGASSAITIPNITPREFPWVESGMNHVLVSIDTEIMVTNVKPDPVSAITKDTFIEYHADFNKTSEFEVYKLLQDCTNEDWMQYADKYEYDPRGYIVYMLLRTSRFDNNMMFATDRNIKEALINYIIYRWFEYVNDVEAEKFYYKYEDYAYKAKMGMESETKPFQRNYKLL